MVAKLFGKMKERLILSSLQFLEAGLILKRNSHFDNFLNTKVGVKTGITGKRWIGPWLGRALTMPGKDEGYEKIQKE